MYKKNKNAYMTVEATIIYPFVFGGILFTICLSMYLYNAAVLNQISYIAALRGSLQTEMSQKEIKSYVSEQITTLWKEKTLFVTKTQENITVTDLKVKVLIKGKVNLPLLKFPFLDFNWNELKTESEAGIIHPVKKIRNLRRVYES